MAFEDYEGSRSKGAPVDLYMFLHGPGVADYYAYTDHETEVTVDVGLPWGPVTFLPRPVRRDTIKSSGTLDKQAMTIALDRTAEVAELFRIYPPTQVVTCTIRQGHIGDPDSEFLVVWSGRTLSCKFAHSEVELTCEPIATSMKRTGLRRHYQYGCPHALYLGDSTGGCRASKAAATVATTAVTITGTLLKVATGWNGAFSKVKFRGGLVEWVTPSGATERRTILRVDEATNVLTLTGLVRSLEIGGALNVVLGCDRQMNGDCSTLHNNVADFGGNPWIPTKNPIGPYNNFY